MSIPIRGTSSLTLWMSRHSHRAYSVIASLLPPRYAMMENRQFLEYMIATNYTNKYGEETLHVMRECFLPFR